MNKQEKRLKKYKKLMLEKRNFIVVHGISFKLKNGMNILLGGPSGSGKSFIFNFISKLGLIDELYDEDLIILDNKGFLKPLGNEVFKGKLNGKYIYGYTSKNIFGKIDIIFFIDNNFYGIKNTIFYSKNIIKYLLHENYRIDNNLIDIYKNFKLFKKIRTYIIGNNKTNTNFNFIIEKLGLTKK